VNAFDAGILKWANQFVHRSQALDSAFVFLCDFDLLKGYAFVLVLWWFWFQPAPKRDRNRKVILATLAASFAAIFLGRALAALLPFRERPLFNPELGLVEPYALGAVVKIRTWSAFPSDHAMMFAALATGIWLMSRRLGAAAFVYAALIIGVPRVYLGLHHPTDILAGGLLGAAMTAAAAREPWLSRLTAKPLEWSRRHESSFYAAFFFLSVMIGTMFDGPRTVLTALAHLAKR
jgi:membrane-associated phospholipid phosphatase